MMGRQPGWEANAIRLLDIFVDGLGRSGGMVEES